MAQSSSPDYIGLAAFLQSASTNAELSLNFDLYGMALVGAIHDKAFVAEVTETAKGTLARVNTDEVLQRLNSSEQRLWWTNARDEVLEGSSHVSLNRMATALVPVLRPDRQTVTYNVYKLQLNTEHLIQQLAPKASEQLGRLVDSGELSVPHTSLWELANVLGFATTSANDSEQRWDEFVHWCSRAMEWDGFDATEREYKIQVATNVAQALAQLRSGLPSKPSLEIAFKNPPNNLLNWRSCDAVKKWFARDDAIAREATLALVRNDSRELSQRLTSFFGALTKEDIAGPSARVSVASLFLMGEDYAAYPFYQFTPIDKALTLSGHPKPPKGVSEAEIYLHACDFLMKLREALEAAGSPPRDLLEVQSAVWVVSKSPLTGLRFLSDRERADLARFRGEAVPEAPTIEGGVLAPPFDDQFQDIAEAEWAFRLFRATVDALKIEGPDDVRFAITQSATPQGNALNLIFAGWKILSIHPTAHRGPRLRLALGAERADALGLARSFDYQQRPDELEIGMFDLSVADANPMSDTLDAAFNETLDVVFERFRNHGATPHRRHHIPELLEAVLDPEKRHKLLTDGYAPVELPDPYTVEDAMRGLFLSRDRFEDILALLRRKQNLILQGPPGVGKTHMVKRLAYALMEEADDTRVAMVQFHQSYTYEDFIQGYRPTQESTFERKNGVFHQFCARAKERPDDPHVFIIDEINRGNLSKIFGELMMLIEPEKRGEEWQVPLQYAESIEDKFSVPKNVYLVGMMNTADRSLALVDYAIRRRFVFVDLEPCFNDAFADFLAEAGVASGVISSIRLRLTELNGRIAKDTINLGKGFCVGHSYFCRPSPTMDDDEWYRSVVKYEVAPLLEEYWFDDEERASKEVDTLLGLT